MEVFLLIWVIGAILACVIANNKNRSAGGWLLANILVSPLIILILLALSPLSGNKRGCPSCGRENLFKAKMCKFCGVALPRVVPLKEETKKCPYCAESIKVEAKVCKHCGKDQPEAAYKPYEFK